jgi:AcrR family transcriptional regulator
MGTEASPFAADTVLPFSLGTKRSMTSEKQIGEQVRDIVRLPLRERNKQRNFQRIVDASFELFHTIGYNQTTMDAIAEKAEVSRATLFNYFPAKHSLLLPFANRLYEERVQPEIQPYLETQPTMIQALQFLFMRIQEHVLMFPDIYPALQEEFFHPPSETKHMDNAFFKTLILLLQYGQGRGEVRVDIPLVKLAHYVGILYVSLLFQPLKLPLLTSYSKEVTDLLLFLHSALNPILLAEQ